MILPESYLLYNLPVIGVPHCIEIYWLLLQYSKFTEILKQVIY